MLDLKQCRALLKELSKICSGPVAERRQSPPAPCLLLHHHVAVDGRRLLLNRARVMEGITMSLVTSPATSPQIADAVRRI
jgi:hypothetical protein